MRTAPLESTSPLDTRPVLGTDTAGSADLSRYLRQHLADLESSPTHRERGYRV